MMFLHSFPAILPYALIKILCIRTWSPDLSHLVWPTSQVWFFFPFSNFPLLGFIHIFYLEILIIKDTQKWGILSSELSWLAMKSLLRPNHCLTPTWPSRLWNYFEDSKGIQVEPWPNLLRSEQFCHSGLRNPERHVFAQILSKKHPKISPKLPEGILGFLQSS